MGPWPWGHLPGSARGGPTQGLSAPGPVRAMDFLLLLVLQSQGLSQSDQTKHSFLPHAGLSQLPASEGGPFWKKDRWAGQAGCALIRDNVILHCSLP